MHNLYTRILGIETDVSRIFIGTCNDMFSNEYSAAIEDLIDYALSKGICAIDTARCYGSSEKNLGEYFSKHNNRSRFVVLSKGGLANDGKLDISLMRSDIKNSLANLRTDYVDIYLAHRDNKDVSVCEIIETMNEFIANGYTKAIGVSNWTYERIAEANEYAYKMSLHPFAISSPEFSMMEQVTDYWGGTVSIGGNKGKEERSKYGDDKVTILAYSPLAHGFISSRNDTIFKMLSRYFIKDEAYKIYGSMSNVEILLNLKRLARRKKCTIEELALSYIWDFGENTCAAISMRSHERIDSVLKSLTMENFVNN